MQYDQKGTNVTKYQQGYKSLGYDTLTCVCFYLFFTWKIEPKWSHITSAVEKNL